MQTRIEIYAHEHLPADLAAILDTWQRETFFPDEHGVIWTYSSDWDVVVWADGEPVSYLGIFKRTGRVNGQAVRLAGIAGMAGGAD